MKKYTPYLLLSPSLLIMIVFVGYPLIDALRLSLFSYRFGRESSMIWNGLSNYLDLFSNPRFWNSLKNTLIFSSTSVILSFLFGFLLALLFWNMTIKGENIYRSLILLPTVLTPVVVGLIWKWMLDPMFGLVNYLLNIIGISGPLWLGNPNMAMASIVLVDVWQYTPFTFLVLLAGLKSLPVELYEAAKVDGASGWQSLTQITIPLLRPIIIIVLLLRTYMSIRSFDNIYVLTRGGPGTATEVLNMYTYRVGFEFLRMGSASTLSIIIFIVTLLLSFLLLRSTPGIEEES